MSKTRILFIGDIFGLPGVKTVEKLLPEIIEKHKIDFVIAQGENVTGRKGLNFEDYQRLMQAGVNCLTMGNHVWANQDIYNFIDSSNVIRPYNIQNNYPGVGSLVFLLKNNKKLRVTSLLGLTFNQLMKPWEQEVANNFFDAIDELIEKNEADYHFVDFHGETTSEKYVFGLYVDGKIDAVCGTHTHVQTNDYKILPNGTCFITDAGMTGPENSAIGANFEEVYEKMRFDSKKPFTVSQNSTQFNSVIIEFNDEKSQNSITPLNFKNIYI